MPNELRNFLSLSYEELEQLNLHAKDQRKKRVAIHKVQEERLKYLRDEKRVKAVTVLFTDLEGRLHMLDYDKKFLINSWDNLTFDGSSIRGFTAQRESDLRLAMDWGACYSRCDSHVRRGLRGLLRTVRKHRTGERDQFTRGHGKPTVPYRCPHAGRRSIRPLPEGRNGRTCRS